MKREQTSSAAHRHGATQGFCNFLTVVGTTTQNGCCVCVCVSVLFFMMLPTGQNAAYIRSAVEVFPSMESP